MDFQNALGMCTELQALNMTLNRQELRHSQALQETVAHRVQQLNFNPQDLAEWATSFIQSIALTKAQERKRLEGCGPELLNWVKLGPSMLEKASGIKTQGKQSPSICDKRPAPSILNRSPKGIILREVEESHETQENQECSVNIVDDIRESVVLVATPSRTEESSNADTTRSDERWSWKKVARSRNRGELNRPQNLDTPGQSSRGQRQNERESQDFHRAEEAGQIKPPPPPQMQ